MLGLFGHTLESTGELDVFDNPTELLGQHICYLSSMLGFHMSVLIFLLNALNVAALDTLH